MYGIAAFGLLVIVLSLLMIVSPAGWSRGILSFSGKPYFHAAEVVSRLLLGGILIFYAGQTTHPMFMAVVGYLFLGVGAGLLLAGAKRHRAFAVRSASFSRIFRPAGFVSLVFGIFVLCSALGWPTGSQ